MKEQVRTARLRAHRVVNTELLQLYWAIGHVILERQAAEGWGTARRANGKSHHPDR